MILMSVFIVVWVILPVDGHRVWAIWIERFAHTNANAMGIKADVGMLHWWMDEWFALKFLFCILCSSHTPIFHFPLTLALMFASCLVCCSWVQSGLLQASSASSGLSPPSLCSKYQWQPHTFLNSPVIKVAQTSTHMATQQAHMTPEASL